MNKILFFSAPWCGQCKALKPRFERAMQGLKTPYTFINVDAEEDYLDKYNIRSIPTLILVNEQGEELKRGDFFKFDDFIKEVKEYE